MEEKKLNYPDTSLYDFLEHNAKKDPKAYALNYFSRKMTYEELLNQIEECAKALKAIGVKKNEAVSICLPNIPQAVIAFYAINKIGAIANMIHPLSAENEIAYYLDISESRYIIAIDLIKTKLDSIADKVKLKRRIFVSVKDFMPFTLKLAYSLTNKGKKNDKEADKNMGEKGELSWKNLMAMSKECVEETNGHGAGSDEAAILYSGGTTGKPKGILLTNLNFNALAMQSIEACGNLQPKDKVLSIMPIFHGFGLGVCIHTVLNFGGVAILLPKFKATEFDKLLLKYKPNVIAGVPAIYETLLQGKRLKNKDLSFLKCIISGGDSLSTTSKEKLNHFFIEHKARGVVREGYGLTECVTGSCLMPDQSDKVGSVGLPYPDTYYKIVDPGTHEELPCYEVGEIILRGPTVMKGYLKDEKETSLVLKKHKDNHIWLHTGDLGYKDEDGFIYFKQRLKRMIVSSGYNIYPQSIENVISSHSSVLTSVVVGVHDEIKGQIVKAFVVLKDGEKPTRELRNELYELCKKNIAKYALPREIAFIDSIPKTLVGKIDYGQLARGYKNEK